MAAAGPEPLTWALHKLTSIDFLKMSVIVVLVLLVWLRPDGRVNGRAEAVVRGVLGLVLALLVDHAIQIFVRRMRPRFALQDLPWPPYDMDWSNLISNAFPSDHAVLVSALVAIVWGACRRLGPVALVWAVFGVCLPRIYFGFHWPTDLIAGGLIGAAGVVAMRRVPLPPWAWRWLERLERASPATVIIGVFFFAYECMISFFSTRGLLKMARDVARAVGLV